MELKQVDESLDVVQCKLRSCTFNDVDMSNAEFKNANLSHWLVEDVTMEGTKITNANLSGVAISDCLLKGMTINGHSVEEMLKAVQKA